MVFIQSLGKFPLINMLSIHPPHLHQRDEIMRQLPMVWVEGPLRIRKEGKAVLRPTYKGFLRDPSFEAKKQSSPAKVISDVKYPSIYNSKRRNNSGGINVFLEGGIIHQ